MMKSIALLIIAILIIDTVVLGISSVQQAGKLTEAGANITRLEGQISILTGETAALRQNISILQASIAESEAKSIILRTSIAESEAKSITLQDALNKANTALLKVREEIKLSPPAPAFDPTAPAAFVTSDLRINATHLEPADTGTVSVMVTNTGGQTGTYQVVLKVNGETFATKSVILDGGKSTAVNFGIKPDKEMKAVISVDNLSVAADWQTH